MADDEKEADKPWNLIGDRSKLNEKNDGIRSLREYTKSQSIKNNDGGFSKGDDVLFFSKIDNQYIPGIILEKKRDKLTKNIVYKIRKIHKRDPEIDEELKKKSRSKTEDPRVEIIKLREQRAKKPATIIWDVKKSKESYFKIISANDYQIELQIALLKLLKNRVKETIKKRKKFKKMNEKSEKIGDKMSKSKEKRVKKQRVAQTFSGTRSQMMALSKKAKSSKRLLDSPKSPTKRSRSRPTKRSSSKKVLSGSDDSETEEIELVSKPAGNAIDWTEEDVLTWLRYISQNECSYENDSSLKDEERKNYKKARMGLFVKFFEKFINADIDGKALSKLDNVKLQSKVYMKNKIEKNIVMKHLDELFPNRHKLIKHSDYVGTDYDFSKDWKKSNIEELKFQKRKAAAGNLSKMKLSDIGRNDNYKGTEWTKEISEQTKGGIYDTKVSAYSKRFDKRKAKAGHLKRQTVSEIGISEDYEIPDYADKAIADTMVGQATDERSRWGGAGMDLEGENQELLRVLLHSNITIPLELTTPVKGYHTIQNRNAQLRNLLMKHRALMDEEQDTDDPEVKRQRGLKAARDKFENEMDKKEQEAMSKGDFSEIHHIYGRKHKKVRDWELLQKEKEKMLKKEEVGRKYHKRLKKNQQSLALLKKRDKRSSSIEPKKQKKSAKKQQSPPKRPMSARNTVNLPVFSSNSNSPKLNGQKKKKKGPKRVSFNVDVGTPKKAKSYEQSPVTSHVKSDSLQSTGSVVLHSGTTPKLDGHGVSSLDDESLLLSPSAMDIGYQASLDQMQEEEEHDFMISVTPDVDNDNNESVVERLAAMHSKDSKSVVIHHLAQSSSMDFDTSWVDTSDAENESVDIGSVGPDTSSSSELTFSDDGNEEEDENDAEMVPLGVQMMMQQKNGNMSDHNDDFVKEANIHRMETLESQRSME